MQADKAPQMRHGTAITIGVLGDADTQGSCGSIPASILIAMYVCTSMSDSDGCFTQICFMRTCFISYLNSKSLTEARP